MMFAIFRTVSESIVNGWLVAMFKDLRVWIRGWRRRKGDEEGREGEYVCSIFLEKVISMEILLEIT